MAAAAIPLYVYLNFQQGPDDLPADEVALTFATVAIHSCADAANAAAVDKQIQQLVEAELQARPAESAWAQQQQPAAAGGEHPLFGCAQVGQVLKARLFAHLSRAAAPTTLTISF
jgi:hypothetical protein